MLELGCGTDATRFLASIGAKVLATDGSAGMLREAEIREIRERTSEPERRPTYRQLALPPEWEEDRGRAAALAVLGVTEPFDAVVAVGVLQHPLGKRFARPRPSPRPCSNTTASSSPRSRPHPGAKTSDGRWYSDLPVEGYEEVFGP